MYLAAAIVWGGLYTGDQTKTAVYASVLEDAIPELKAFISRQNRAVMRLDPALASIGGRKTFNVTRGY